MKKVAIHHRPNSFSECWIEFCEQNNVPHKVVDCYQTDIIRQLEDCNIVMWHYHHTNSKDFLFARQLLFSLEASGKKVFPDFHTGWHFDDKVGQKYLLEAAGAPLVPSYIFFNKTEAYHWADEAAFPKVFKLRKGAGSSHVKLVKNKKEAKKLISQAFAKGFSQYEAGSNLKERWRKFKNRQNNFIDLLKGVLRFGYSTDFDRIAGNERGYIYFQDFIPGNDSDIRVIVIHDRAFAIKRLVRRNDFRASGSGMIEYEKKYFNKETIKLAFDVAQKLKSQCIALDFVYDKGNPLIVEISYGYTKEGYADCVGYWDEQLNWHEGSFNNPQHWMVKSLLNRVDV